MEVKIIAVTQPLVEVNHLATESDPSGKRTLSADEFIAFCARVSNPSNQMNTLTAPKLVKYLIKNKHWSPFELVHVVMSIETTRDIAHQILRHRSFSFQEFSQRYADPTKGMGFTISEVRLQDPKNRQNSIEIDIASDVLHEELQKTWDNYQGMVIDEAKIAYEWAIDNGIAKEVARKVLPEGLTNTKLYMSGSLRSWIHYIDVRAPEGTQKEHRLVAQPAQDEILKYFPSLEEYWRPVTVDEVVQLTWLQRLRNAISLNGYHK